MTSPNGTKTYVAKEFDGDFLEGYYRKDKAKPNNKHHLTRAAAAAVAREEEDAEDAEKAEDDENGEMMFNLARNELMKEVARAAEANHLAQLMTHDCSLRGINDVIGTYIFT